MKSRHLLVVLCALLFTVTVCSQATDTPVPNIPTLPNYFSGYMETISTIQETNTTTVALSNEFYDKNRQLVRVDNPIMENPGTGEVSLIQVIDLSVQYVINRQFNNCTVSSLYNTTFNSDIEVNVDGSLRLKSLRELLLFPFEDYTYVGVKNANGVKLDTWSASGNLTTNRFNVTDSVVQISFTKPGTRIPSISSVNVDPIPWRVYVTGLIDTSDGTNSSRANISIVKRIFDFSVNEPSFDIYDVSICSNPIDYQVLTLLIPEREIGIHFSQFRGSIRRAISNYTSIHPIQIGNIDIIEENGTFVFVTLHISNLTTLAQTSIPSKSANSVIQMIINNTINGLAPFHIEISPGEFVTPIIFLPDNKCPNTSTSFVTVTPTCTNAASILVPSGSSSVVVITTTYTITVTPSTCPLPLATLSTTRITCPSPSPLPAIMASGLATGPAIGMALGLFFVGILSAFVFMCIIMICCRRSKNNRWTPSAGISYEKQEDELVHEYFQ